MISDNKVLADFGNSRVKFVINNQIKAFEYDSEELKSFIESIETKSIVKLVYSSVNKQDSDIVIDKLKQKGLEIYDIAESIDKVESIDFSNITGMGTDRKLSLLAVHRLSDSPTVTVDCGTAITVNILDEDNICHGGVIFPGFYTQAKALNEFTSGLPLVDSISIDENKYGDNTQDAIKNGILNSIVGGIVCTIRNSPFSAVPDVYVTGGYGEYFIDCLSKRYPNVIYDEHLVLKGMEQMLNNTIQI
ncbi:MAG: type III pantothenate kinase [Chlorobiota bacterium]